MSGEPRCSLVDSGPPMGAVGLLSSELDHSKLLGFPQKSASKLRLA